MENIFTKKLEEEVLNFLEKEAVEKRKLRNKNKAARKLKKKRN
jgi:hypothetical protein